MIVERHGLVCGPWARVSEVAATDSGVVPARSCNGGPHECDPASPRSASAAMQVPGVRQGAVRMADSVPTAGAAAVRSARA